MPASTVVVTTAAGRLLAKRASTFYKRRKGTNPTATAAGGAGEGASGEESPAKAAGCADAGREGVAEGRLLRYPEGSRHRHLLGWRNQPAGSAIEQPRPPAAIPAEGLGWRNNPPAGPAVGQHPPRLAGRLAPDGGQEDLKFVAIDSGCERPARPSATRGPKNDQWTLT